jgi:hypothetical protein
MSKARDLANAGTALTTVSATELGYLDGVTSAVQTQINAKEATLPDQTGNTGKYLTTNGTAKSWGTVSQYALPSQTGNSGKFLTTNGTAESWGTVSSSLTLAQVATGSLTSGTTLSLSSLTGDYYLIHFSAFSGTNATINLKFNGSTGNLYDWSSSSVGQSTTSYNNTESVTNSLSIELFPSTQSSSANDTWIEIKNAKAAGFTTFHLHGFFNSGGQDYLVTTTGIYKSAAQVTSMVFTRGTAFVSGTYTIWGG